MRKMNTMLLPLSAGRQLPVPCSDNRILPSLKNRAEGIDNCPQPQPLLERPRSAYASSTRLRPSRFGIELAVDVCCRQRAPILSTMFTSKTCYKT
jgi:hypothetical protein